MADYEQRVFSIIPENRFEKIEEIKKFINGKYVKFEPVLSQLTVFISQERKPEYSQVTAEEIISAVDEVI
jgi:hypothetical protein